MGATGSGYESNNLNGYWTNKLSGYWTNREWTWG